MNWTGKIKVRKRDKIKTNIKIETPKIHKKEKYKFNWNGEFEVEDLEKLGII